MSDITKCLVHGPTRTDYKYNMCAACVEEMFAVPVPAPVERSEDPTHVCGKQGFLRGGPEAMNDKCPACVSVGASSASTPLETLPTLGGVRDGLRRQVEMFGVSELVGDAQVWCDMAGADAPLYARALILTLAEQLRATARQEVQKLDPPSDAPTREGADWQRVCNWMRDPNRKPANTAFTAGPERQLAYAFEDSQMQRSGLSHPSEKTP